MKKKIIRFKMKKRRYGGSIIINERRWREEASCVVPWYCNDISLGGNYEVYNIILKRKKSQEEGRERKN